MKQHVFDNGLTLIYVEKPLFQKSFACVMVDFGAKDIYFDQTVPKGIAHFLEHKMFEKEEGDYLNAFAALGASANAFTSYNETVYYFSTTTNFEQSFETLLDLVHRLEISEESVEKEKGIILQEISMYRSDPDTRMYQRLIENMYAHTPIRYEILGAKEDIEQTTVAHLNYCFNHFYRPDNMVVIVVSAIDFNTIIDLMKKHSITTKIGKEVLTQKTYTEQQDVCCKEEVMTLPIQNDKTLLGLKLPPIPDLVERKKMECCLKVLATLQLTTMNTNYQEWFASKTITDYFGFDIDMHADFSMLVLYNESDNMDFLQSLIPLLIHSNISEEHLLLLKKRLYSGFVRLYDEFERLGILVGKLFFQKKPLSFEAEMIKNLTIEDIQNAQNYLKNGKISTLYVKKQQK